MCIRDRANGTAGDTLSITDSRTGASYEIPIREDVYKRQTHERPMPAITCWSRSDA